MMMMMMISCFPQEVQRYQGRIRSTAPLFQGSDEAPSGSHDLTMRKDSQGINRSDMMEYTVTAFLKKKMNPVFSF